MESKKQMSMQMPDPLKKPIKPSRPASTPFKKPKQQNLKSSAAIMIKQILNTLTADQNTVKFRLKAFTNDPLWKATLYTVRSIGMTDEEIDAELRRNHILASALPPRSANDFSYLQTVTEVRPQKEIKIVTHVNEYTDIVRSFDIDRILQLEKDKRKQVCEYCLEYQTGIFSARCYNIEYLIDCIDERINQRGFPTPQISQ